MNLLPQQSNRRFSIILALLLILTLIGTVPTLNSDGREYFLQLRSIILNGDASYWDEFIYHFEGGESDFRIEDALPSGYVPIRFPLGFAVLLTPFFLVGHWIALLLYSIGLGAAANGYTFSEVLLPLLASAGLGLLGVWISGIIAAKKYGVRAGLWATLALWWASPLPAYIYAQPSFAHSLSVLTSAAVLFLWLRDKDNQVVKQGLVMGLAVGIAALVRWQDLVYLLFPACEIIRQWYRWKLRKSIIYIGLVCVGLVIGLAPQLLLWKIHFGTWVTIPQGQGFMRWANPEVWQVIFGARHGLVSWTPVMAISIIGMIWMAIRKSAIGIPILLVFILQVYINSVAWDWWAGWGFGGRRFLDMVPFFILGTAFFISQLPHRVKKLMPIVVSILIIWNLSLLYHFFAGHVNFSGEVFLADWCRENAKLLLQHPVITFLVIVFVTLVLWITHRIATGTPETSNSWQLRWQPSAWLIGVTVIYLAVWSLNLIRTTIGTERIQISTQKNHYREWQRYTYRSPFLGSGLQDTSTPDNPWQHLAPWGVEPGGNWKLVTACAGELEPGDTAAVLQVVSIDHQKWDQPILWGQTTGPVEIDVQSSPTEQSNAPTVRIDLPPKAKILPYRTFEPVPMYLWRWLKFSADYSNGRIPLHAAYEHNFALPDDFTPKRFEIHLIEAVKCNIYGIGKVLNN